MAYNNFMWKNLSALLFASLLFAGCGGNVTPTLAPITPIVDMDTLLATPRPPLDPSTLSKDTRGCYIPLEDYTQLYSVENGYCLVYPGYFHEDPANSGPTLAAIKGPERSADPVPVHVTVSIQVVPAGEKTLDQAVEDIFKMYEGADIFRTPVMMDGQPADILDNIPGPFTTRQAVSVVNGMLYTISMTPADEDSPSTQYDSSDVWFTVISTLHYFPPEVASTAPSGLDTSMWAKQDLSGLGIGFLLPQEWELTSSLDAFDLAPRGKYTPSWIVIRTLPDLPANDLALLKSAILQRFQEGSITYGEINQGAFNGLDAIQVTGRPDLCLDTYVPAYGLVHEISVHPDLCDASSEITNDEARAILDSMHFFQAVE